MPVVCKLSNFLSVLNDQLDFNTLRIVLDSFGRNVLLALLITEKRYKNMNLWMLQIQDAVKGGGGGGNHRLYCQVQSLITVYTNVIWFHQLKSILKHAYNDCGIHTKFDLSSLSWRLFRLVNGDANGDEMQGLWIKVRVVESLFFYNFCNELKLYFNIASAVFGIAKSPMKE